MCDALASLPRSRIEARFRASRCLACIDYFPFVVKNTRYGTGTIVNIIHIILLAHILHLLDGSGLSPDLGFAEPPDRDRGVAQWKVGWWQTGFRKIGYG